jgi:pyridoxine 4-dehydrogenase
VDLDDAVADAHGATRYQVALAWLLAHSEVTNVAASAIELTDEEDARLA